MSVVNVNGTHGAKYSRIIFPIPYIAYSVGNVPLMYYALALFGLLLHKFAALATT